MPKAYSYIRFSSEKQQQGDSVRRQLEAAESYASQHNLELDTRSYRDLGISAFKGKNASDGALRAFIDAADAGLIEQGSFLLVEGIDRLSRMDVDDALQLFLSIIERGITIVTLADGQVFNKGAIKENWTKLIIALAVMARANEESRTKASRVSKAIQAKLAANKPLASSCPTWLSFNADKTGYVLLPDKVQVVRRMFSMALDGAGIYLIMKRLNEEGVPRLKNAKLWTVDAVSRVLHQTAVFGRLSSKHGTYDDHYPAIVSKEDFYKVQELIKVRNTNGKGRKGENVANLFGGLCRCGECGSTMRFLRIPTKGNLNSYIECTDSYQKHGCTAKRLNYDPIERALLKELLEYRAVEINDRTALEDPSATIKAEIADKKTVIARLLDMIEAVPEAEAMNLLGRLSQRQEELAKLEEQLRTVVVPAPMADVWAEAVNVLEEHERLKETDSPELAALRLKLQSKLKLFIDKIEFPMALVVDKSTKVLGRVKKREALISYRGRWDMVLTKRDLARSGRGKRITEETLQYSEQHPRKHSILYDVPLIGGYKGRKKKLSSQECSPQSDAVRP